MSKFWDKFSDLMDELPTEIESHKAVGVVVKKKTVNGKVVEDTVIVDGEEYVKKSLPEDKK